MKTYFGLKPIFTTALALVALFAVAGQPSGDSRGALAAPVVAVDDYGLFSVNDCPMTDAHFALSFHMGEFEITSADVLWDGVEVQTLRFNEEDCIVREQVHFLDANFDGYLDILIGPGTNREYSALFLWSEDESMFVRATIDGFSVFNGDFFFEPERMAVYRRTSSSFAETTYTMMVWQGSDLQSEETFLIIGDKSYYDSYRVTHRYTVRNYYSDEDIISTDDASFFEGTWSEWAIKMLEE